MRAFFKRSSLVSYGLLLLLGSCVSMGRIAVQVPVPAPRSIPDDIQSLVVMNGSMTEAFKNLNQDTLENLFVKKKLTLDDVMLDSTAADTTIKSIANYLYKSGRYDVVVPLKRNLPDYNATYYQRSAALSLPNVRQICDEFNVDALLVLENFSEKVNTSFRIDPFPFEGFAGTVAYIQVAYHSNWKLYQPKEKLTSARFEVNDTIFWEQSGATLQETYEKLPTIKESLLSAAVENASSLAAYVSPGWKEEVRKYYVTGDAEADRAIRFVNKDDWKEAEKIWLKFASVSSAGLRSKIEFNLALASEMNGNKEKAISWAEKSLQSKYAGVTEEYLRILNSRAEVK